ncbi:hypothetical protein [Paenibacillus popilliae]|uniref:hypothetical protein n=1 Tax=Paenibacillus popilliae TaxID=78057 RepID=UPI0011D1B504|nr:hypothetical protein [Paenibacillus popilliae]
MTVQRSQADSSEPPQVGDGLSWINVDSALLTHPAHQGYRSKRTASRESRALGSTMHREAGKGRLSVHPEASTLAHSTGLQLIAESGQLYLSRVFSSIEEPLD